MATESNATTRDVPAMRIPRRLVGRVAVVTGAGHGIGRAYARRLAQEGASVVIAEIDGPAAEKTAEQLRADDLEVLAITTDVTDEESVHSMAGLTVSRYGRLDILVNNAALFATIPMSRAPWDEISPDEWDRMMQINLKGVWRACLAAVPYMKQQSYGKIINISSGTVFNAPPTRIHYVTSKAGVIGFTRVLARELGTHNITV